MKKLVLACITALFLFACQQKPEVKNRKTIICGKVTGFEKVASDSLIRIQYHDLATDFNELIVWIDSEGTFRKEIDISSPKEILFSYASRLSFYLEPGDSLFVEIDAACKETKPENYHELYSYFNVSGSVSKMNEDVMSYTAFFNDSLRTSSKKYLSKIKNCNPNDYRNYMDSLEKAMNSHVAEFSKVNNTCDKFKTWVEHEIKYEKWFHLCRYPKMHPMMSGKDIWEFIAELPKNYLDFIEFDSNTHEPSLVSKNYIGAIQEYYNLKDLLAYKTIKDLPLKDEQALIADTIFRILIDGSSGFNKDLLVSQHYLKSLNENRYESLKDILDTTLINNEQLRQVVVERFNSVAAKYNNPQYAVGSVLNELATESDYLQELIKKYPNKIIYLDFWAPWCGPCMQEIPHAEAIKNKMEGKDVVFVYLGSRCSEENWKATIAEKKIEGEHFFLNDKQYAHLSQVFGVRGIPHFVIIDKQGNIAEQRAPRPSSGDKLIETLDALL